MMTETGLLLIIFAHFIGDWALQGEFIAMNKGKHKIVMLVHCMIWAGCISFVLEYQGILVPWKVTMLVGLHWMMDDWKCKNANGFPTWHLYLDQAWHLLQCLIVWVL